MWNRRQWMTVGGLAGLGLGLPRLLQASHRAPARSCILFFMEGGPSHIDLWDPKPDAPETIRGLYRPLATSLPGFMVCEKLPRWAAIARHLAVVKSLHHTIVDHNSSSYWALTGKLPLRGSELIRAPSRDDAPPIGSVLARERPTGQPVPDFVHIPQRMFNCGSFIPAQLAGFLGESFDPLITGDPSEPDFRVPGLSPQPELPPERFVARKQLLQHLHGQGRHGDLEVRGNLQQYFERAYALVTSPRTLQAFRLQDEPDSVRSRYGADEAGRKALGRLSHLGYSFLLARRLIEAGVRLVTIWAGRQVFDTHRDHYPTLSQSLCPALDLAFSALLEDLHERGLLAETLVVATSEFGRTPQLGQVTSSAGATPDGRDHWPRCYTAFLAGGGVRGGQVFGASDRHAAYPTDNAVTPSDLAATVYRLLGIDHRLRLTDSLGRPHVLVDGEPITALV